MPSSDRQMYMQQSTRTLNKVEREREREREREDEEGKVDLFNMQER
jgi:hypothetical protein